jgi:alpha-L-rhamnosidase
MNKPTLSLNNSPGAPRRNAGLTLNMNRRWLLQFGLPILAALTLLSGRAEAAVVTLTDIGSANPTPGTYDISQLTSSTVNDPGGLNYYDNNSAPPGQTFTTGNSPGGYVLNSVALKTSGAGSSSAGSSTTYALYIYSVTSVSSGNATLIATYTATAGFTANDWLQWGNLGLALQPNSQYAFAHSRTGSGYERISVGSGNQPYPGGQIALIPAAGGAMTFGSGGTIYDMTFDLGLTPAVWTGSASANWDTTTANWTLYGTTGNYADGDWVEFGDPGVSHFNLNLASAVAPAGVTFNNSANNYTISGIGGIGGTGSLYLTGTGTVTLNTANSYTGQTVIGTGGALVIGGAGDLGGGNYGGAITDNGTLSFNSTTPQILTNAISGTGGITVSGGTLTLGNDKLAYEGYIGPTVVNGGTLNLNFPNAGTGGIFQSSGLTINNGGTVSLMQPGALEGYTQQTPYLPVTINAGGTLTTANISSAGCHLYGALNLNGGTLAQAGTANITYAGWQIDNQINVNGGTTTSTMSAQQMGPQQSGGTVFNITSGGTSQSVPGVDLLVTGTFTNTSGAADTGIILTGAGVMALAGGSNDIVHGITIGSGTTLLLTNAATIYASGLITNNGAFVDGSTKAQTLSGIMSGTGAVAVTAAGAALTLNAADTYSGNTLINAGTLLLGAAGSINNTTGISVAKGATFDVSALPSYTLGAGASLTAAGTAANPATINGSLSLGSSPVILNYDGSDAALTIASGTLTLNGNAFTVNGTPLPVGQYPLIQPSTGSISSSGTYPVPTGTAIQPGSTASISVSGGKVWLNIPVIKTYPVITWATPSAISYGTALGPSQLNATVNGIAGNIAYTPSAGSVPTAGTVSLTATFTPNDTTTYSSATATVSLVVSPAPLIVTATSTSRPYGQNNPVFAGTLNGIVNNDNITATYNCLATASSPVATYPIFPVFNDPNGRLGNYTVTTNDGTLTVTATSAIQPSAPSSLLVDDISGPVGTEAVPYFGWLDNSANTNEIQTGYEVLVASSVANLNANTGDMWDSGVVASDRENHVVYAGAPLTADTQYYWKVRTWDREGNPGAYSTNSAFTVGLLANSDWIGASWIMRSTSVADDYTYYRKSATLPAKSVQRATVYVTSVHKYTLYVNGTLVGKGPAYAFPQYQLYNAYDITGLVTSGGANQFAILNHWFGGGSGRDGSSRGVLMKAIIHYTDGTSTVVGTDGTWLESQAISWIVTSPVSRGGSGPGYIENIDARNLTPTWFMPGFNDSDWTAPTVYAGGQTNNSTWPGPLLPDLTRIVETPITPVSITMDQSGSAYVVDLGKVYSGNPQITFSGGSSGTVIGMSGGFALLSSGDIDSSQNQTVTMTYSATLNGGTFTFLPQEYLTMRYVVITNPPMPITTANFSFIERNSQMNPAASSFTSPNATLNAVWGLMKQTAPVDAQEEFIDSMRQKGGFLGDGFQESITAMDAQDERPLTRRRLIEMIESMVEFWSSPVANTGRVNACYPDNENGRDIPDYSQMFLGWVWEYYIRTGDLAFLGTNYTQLTNVAQYVNRDLNPATGLITNLLGGSQNGQVSGSYEYGIIDWPPDMQFGYDLNTVRGSGPCSATVINGWAYEDYDIVSRIAGELGNTTDSNYYRGLANNMQTAINGFLINSSGLYTDGLDPGTVQSGHTSQHANAFPLSLNIVPPQYEAGVAALVARSNMNVSALGIIQLERGLGEANQGPALLNIFTNANNYGWAQILSFGGSATWESWTANTDGNSESHGWGDVGLDGYVRYILGLKPLTAQYAQAQIMPLDFTNILSTASGMITTDRGAISVEWDRSAATHHLSFTIPVNVTATAYVPQAGVPGAAIVVDGTNATGTVTNLGFTANGYVGFSGLGSGTHNIERVLQAVPPVSLTATPGNAQVLLNWSPTLGATNYSILRGTSSGNETVTLTSSVTTTNYTDTGVTNGDTYFYVVVANTTVGASGNSPEAYATPLLGVSGSYWTNTVTASAQGWNAGTNWSTGAAFPNAPQAVAVINDGIAANQTIALNQPITVGSLYLGAPGGSYTVAASGGTLTLDNTPGAASLIELATSQGDTISAPIANNGSLAITNFSANTLALSGGISGAAGGIAVNGSVALSGASAYGGGTAVNSGMLFVNNTTGSGTGAGPVIVAGGATLGGAGAIAGAVAVNAGGTLMPGNGLGALTFGSSLTLAGGSAAIMAVSQSPLTNSSVVVAGALTNGGTLILTNVGAAPLLSGDTFTLFRAGSYTGAFAGVVLPPLQAGLGWNTNLLNTAGVVSVVVTAQPRLLSPAISGLNLIFTGTGGVPNATFRIIASTNLLAPLSSWIPVATNIFSSSGGFNVTCQPDFALPQDYYMIVVP